MIFLKLGTIISSSENRTLWQASRKWCGRYAARVPILAAAYLLEQESSVGSTNYSHCKLTNWEHAARSLEAPGRAHDPTSKCCRRCCSRVFESATWRQARRQQHFARFFRAQVFNCSLL